MKAITTVVLCSLLPAWFFTNAWVESLDPNRLPAQIERDAAFILKHRDRDDRNYNCMSNAGGNIGNWGALYGKSMILERIDPDGTEHYRMEKWRALEGEDQLDGLIRASFRGINLVSMEYVMRPSHLSPYCR